MVTDGALMLADLTWTELRDLAPEVRVVLLPVGACEQHGPGMAMATDSRLATEVCRRVSARLRPRVLVAPPLPWGLSDHHMGFPGTITLHPETFYALIRDIVVSLLSHGFRRFLIVNGHGGNMALDDVVCVRLRRETSVELVGAVTYFTLTSTPVGHGGEVEASYALALAPEMVKPGLLAVERPATVALPDLAPATIPWAFHEMTLSGNLGDPTRASAEFGHALLTPMLDRLCAIVRALGEEVPPFQRSYTPPATP
jgi:creatinine amidohydrolase